MLNCVKVNLNQSKRPISTTHFTPLQHAVNWFIHNYYNKLGRLRYLTYWSETPTNRFLLCESQNKYWCIDILIQYKRKKY